MKECKNCHRLLDESFFGANPRNKDGLHSYCKKCVAEKAKLYNQTKGREKLSLILNKQKESGYFVFGHGAYTNKKRSAAQRGIDFYLTEEEYKNWFISTKDVCYYCGCNLDEYLKERDFIIKYKGNNPEILKIQKSVFNTERTRNISIMTVDRKDSSLGYSLDNIVKSCWICNSLKSNKVTENQAKTLMKNIRKLIIEEMQKDGRKEK